LTGSWWRVDLGEAHRVEVVTLWNRTDCCTDRLSDFQVDLLDRAGRVIATEDHPGAASRQTRLDLAARGVHAVRVQLHGRERLSLAEVEVWGTPESCDSRSASRCAEAGEGEVATLSCPSGQVVSDIEFASYGLPTGDCESGFAQGSCHGATSLAELEEACLGQRSCSVAASNGIFRDPCPGTRKHLAVAYSCDSESEGPGPDGAVKVFILAGQSNMVGAGTVSINQGLLDRNGGQGTVEYLVDNPPGNPTYGHLVDPSGEWAERDDVWLVDLDGSGPLTITGETFGPELQFGHVMGDHFEEPVVVIKIAWGGKSLHVDFRPPSSGGEVGPFYTAMVNRVHEVLDNLEDFLPGYRGQGYEIAGFGWHQGWNDRVNQQFNDAYQTNCVNFINDVREEFGAPHLPFVLATTGMTGWDETHPRALSLMEAQLAVPDDSRLHSGHVYAVETRGFWRDQAVSPSNQGYHWNRNAETYFLIGNSMGQQMIELLPRESRAAIDDVFFAQTHVLRPESELFRLVSDREALIKVHVTAEETEDAPAVTALLSLNGRNRTIPLSGPAQLPAEIPSAPGVVEHNYDDSFTGRIPAAWVQPGLSVQVVAGSDSRQFRNLEIGAPTRVIMTMFDVHYFNHSPGDYPEGWLDELEAKWPVSEIELRRLPDVLFEELVIPPRAGLPAARIASKDEYFEQTGQRFDGEQAAALQWSGALKDAAGTRGRISLYYVNIYGAWAGGQAGGFGGVGNGTHAGVLHHELGHALSLPHWCNHSTYPYRGAMHGIGGPDNGEDVHAGPTWAFDLPTGRFLPPTVQPGASRGTAGTYKRDPMCGGGTGDQEEGFLFRHFSDYSVNQMRHYLEGHVLVWRDSLNSWVRWNDATGNYSLRESNNGVRYPVERDVEVISVMAGVSAATPSAILVYPPIGPYTTGLIDLFDPRSGTDRTRADQLFCPSSGCDVSLRIRQGGAEKIYMLALSWDAAADPLSRGSYRTRALNLPARDGAVTSVELLLTPDAEKNGLPNRPTVLDSWTE
jgi:hypothetical protein